MVGIRLLTRNGHDWASRYPLIVRAVNKLKVRSCLIDGEAVCCNRGVSSFEKLRHRSHDPEVFLVAFDLLELDGNDLRREPFEVRKQTLASLLRGSLPGVQFNAHLMHRGDIVFEADYVPLLDGLYPFAISLSSRSSEQRLDWTDPEKHSFRVVSSGHSTGSVALPIKAHHVPGVGASTIPR